MDTARNTNTRGSCTDLLRMNKAQQPEGEREREEIQD